MNGLCAANEGYRLRLIDQLFEAAQGKELLMNQKDCVAIVKACGLASVEGMHVVNKVVDGIEGNSSATDCDRSLAFLQILLDHAGRIMEPFVLPLLTKLLALHADRSNAARDLASSICTKMASLLNPQAFRTIWPVLTAAMVEDDWRIKVAALQMLKTVAPRMSRQLSPLLPDIIPAVSVCIADAKKQVQTVALEALNEACLAITNDDIRHLTPQVNTDPPWVPTLVSCFLYSVWTLCVSLWIVYCALCSVSARYVTTTCHSHSSPFPILCLSSPFPLPFFFFHLHLPTPSFTSTHPSTSQLVSVIARPEESEKALNNLLETTFVANVDASTLSLIAPLLGKVLRNRTTSQLTRKAARVIDNMCRLVREPSDVAPFMPLLLPALEKMIDEIVDEEVQSDCLFVPTTTLHNYATMLL